MNRLALFAALLFFALRIPPVLAVSVPDIIPEDFGAVANDDQDDRAAIQAALDAARDAGGATVKLGPGDYHILVVAANGYGGSSGYHGIVVHPDCTLQGAGPDQTHLILLAGNAALASIGDGIVNGGYQTALSDYGAGGGIRLADFRIDTPDLIGGPTGNLIGIAHADGVTISNVHIGSSRAHGLEINLSRNVTVEDCVFDGRHFASSTLQLDIGLFGAKSLVPTGTVIRDILVRRCEFKGRDEDAEFTAKVIELTHTNSNCMLRNIAFEDCRIEGLTNAGSQCVCTDSPQSREISGLRFERCQFIGKQDVPSLNGLFQLLLNENNILEDLTVRDCQFTGMYSKGLVIISSYDAAWGGWATKQRILVEGNTFAPTLDRPVSYWNAAFRLLCVGACNDVIIRRNHFEVPATAENLPPAYGVVSCLASNNLDLRVEDNVFSWGHLTAAEAPMGGALTGLWVPAYLLEKNAMKSVQRITGNIFLAPPNGITAAIRLSTEVPTTSWAPGGPWTGGLIAGNFISGTGSRSPWIIHWDLTEAGDIGTIMPEAPERRRAQGWYLANGAPLTSLDSGKNALARINAGKCGYSTHLPSLPGNVVRLHGPLGGEGLLLEWFRRYTGSLYQGFIHNTTDELAAQPVAERFHGELRVVRQPLAVYRWEGSLSPESAPLGVVEPLDKLYGEAGCWAPLQTGLEQLDNQADPDGDGLTTAQEIALLRDPLIPDSADSLSLTRASPADPVQVRFRCASGPHSPRMCLLSSTDLENWQIETSCSQGSAFDPPAGGTLTESPSLTGREVILSTPEADRRFWKLSFEP